MKKIFSLSILAGLVGVLSLSLPARSAKADHAVAGQGPIVRVDDGDTENEVRPDVAWNQGCDKFLVVYDAKHDEVDYSIHGTYINGDGMAVNAGSFLITDNDLQQKDPAVAYNRDRSNFVVVWEDYRNNQWEIWAQRVGCNKDLIGDPIQITTNQNVTHYQLNPDVACGYSRGKWGCWVVWEDFRNGNWDIYAQKLTAAGLLDGENLQLTSNTTFQRNPAIAYNSRDTGCAPGGSFMVVWNDTRNSAQGAGTDIYAQQLDGSTLCRTNLSVFTGAGDQRDPDIAYGMTQRQYQVVWEDNRNNGDWDIYARMTSPNGISLGVSFALAKRADSSQVRPAIAYDAEFTDEFTTVWEDNRNGSRDIYSQRTGGSGPLIAANSSIVVTLATEISTAIAFGNIAHHYFVVWEDSGVGIKGSAIWR